MNKNKFLIDLSESARTQFGKTPFASQSIPQKVFSAVWAVESEVNNGGFEQYFINESAETAGYAVQAFKAIGAPQTADICQRALSAAFPDGLPADAAAISLAAEDFSPDTQDELGELDEEFMDYPHNLTDLLFAYVAKYPGEFGAVPTE